MSLSYLECKNAKGRDKPYKISAGGGLYLEVMPNGSKYWRMKYRFDGKEKRLAFGVFDTVGVKDACDKRDEAKKLLSNGVDPAVYKKEAEAQRKREVINTFEKIAREWHEAKKIQWSEKYATTIMNRLETDVFPEIGSVPIINVDAPVLLEMLRKIEGRGVYETTRRALQYCGQILRYGVAIGCAERDCTPDLKDALKTKKTEHYAAITPQELPQLLKDLESNKARMYEPTQLAVRLMLLTFLRTSELIKAKWDEFNFEDKIWTVPADRMKCKKSHLVPLSTQTIETLERLKEYNWNREWVFASHVKPKRHMSNNTILTALYRMGYKGKMTGHGFRALALTTLLEELHYPFDVADTQLAHSKRGSLGAAYDRAQFLEQRKVMMQDWADYIDGLI